MKRLSMVFVFFSLFLGACGSPRMDESAPVPPMAPVANSGMGGGGTDGYSFSVSEEEGRASQTVAVAYDPGVAPAGSQRMVIENVDLSLVVKAPHQRAGEIGLWAKQWGGFVVSNNLYEVTLPNGGKAPQAELVIRIPSEKLEEALSKLKLDVVEVTNENRTGQDVTQEYTDLSSRLKNLEATEKQLTQIMEKADKTEDVMAVFSQLSQVREQIEVIKGQMKYYEQSVALSAVIIRLVAEETVQPVQIGPWKPEGVVRDAVQALIEFLKDFFQFLVWLVVLYIPAGFLILLLVFVLMFLVWKFGGFLVRRLFLRSPKAARPVQVAAKPADADDE